MALRFFDSTELDALLNLDNEPIIVDMKGWKDEMPEYAGGHGAPGNQNALGNRFDMPKREVQRRKNSRWYNNSISQVFTDVKPPGDDWIEGRLPFATSNYNNGGENNPRAIFWRLTFDDNSVIIVKGLKAWCKNQPNINYNGLYNAFKRQKPYKHIMEIIKL